MTALKTYFSRRAIRLELWRHYETPHTWGPCWAWTAVERAGQ